VSGCLLFLTHFSFAKSLTFAPLSTEPQNSQSTALAAKAGNIEISDQDLRAGKENEFYEIENKLFKTKKDRLEEILIDRFVQRDADEFKMDSETFIQTKILNSKAEPSEKEILELMRDRGILKSQLNKDLKKQMTSYLKNQKRKALLRAYLANKLDGKPIQTLIKAPQAPTVNIALEGAPTFGGDKAKVTVVEFSDFECPFCSRAANTVNKLKKVYGDKIKVVFKNYPLPFHKSAKPAAFAAMCAHDQGRFWEFHDKIFDNQKNITQTSFVNWAKELKLDTKKFETCLSDKKHASNVNQDISQGEKAGVQSTPTFFINGRLVAGAVPFSAFKEMIDEALEN